MVHTVSQNIMLLKQGAELLRGIDPDLFRSQEHGASPGSHFRHALDFYQCFVQSFASRRQDGSVLIDYDARERNSYIEREPEAAHTLMKKIMMDLHPISEGDDFAVQVRVEASQPPDFVASTLKRELMFLATHTIHHFAIISLLLRLHGVDVPEGFGVAPSTLEYMARIPRR